ncbi:unnamed protein product [Spirodela intermedia]|uniref:BURP domain-containing protein n=1 Tax=Spirodela intermedia TaxID=51605 RepID=A0A7I8KY84_SPIIN|nr:unnamed protein product [Spirodela intermedia]
MARSLFVAVAAASAANLAPQNYWETVLPNTPIPSALRQLLPAVPRRLTVFHSASADAKAGVDSSLFGVGVTVGTSPPTGVFVGVLGFNYAYAATDTQVHDNADVALFFQEKDLVPGSKMNLHFTRTASNSAFLPRSVANSIPFSSAKMSDILSLLSVEPHSEKAAAIEKTLHRCEEPAVAGETSFCATSLESMVDFTTASLGSRDLQTYVIAPSGVQKLAGGKAVACHAQSYAYAVFYCHATRATKSYVVSLAGKDGTLVEAVVVCHTDTSSWNPKHIAFQLLKVSPGTPVCHFLPQDHVVWTRRT